MIQICSSWCRVIALLSKQKASRRLDTKPGNLGEVVYMCLCIVCAGRFARPLADAVELRDATLVHHANIRWAVYTEKDAARSVQRDSIVPGVIKDLLDRSIEIICLLWVGDILLWGETANYFFRLSELV